jgi:AcrR family transcriptional regulator
MATPRTPSRRKHPGAPTPTKTSSTTASEITEVEPADAKVDGRTLRAERTRTAIVDALLALLEEGDLQPPASRIAERAGISLRLIYHHFGDLESLFAAAANREAERLASLAVPIDLDLPFEKRLQHIVDQRASQLETIAPVRRASLLQEPFSENLRRARDAFYVIGAHQMQTVFAKEVAALPPKRRAAANDALSVVLSWGPWNDLREMGKSVDECKAAVTAMLRGVLRP